MRFKAMLCLAAALAVAGPSFAQSVKPNAMHGVNLAGGEFAGNKLPGVLYQDYIYPSEADITLFTSIGMNVIRVPFLWERVQPSLKSPISTAELSRLDAVVAAGQKHGATIVLDMHDYGMYNGSAVGSKAVPVTAFSGFWKQMALHYRNAPNVAYGIMNEPYAQQADAWAAMAQATLLAIRFAGARQMVLVPGTIYSGAHSWFSKVGKLSNAQALAHVKDPVNNYVIELHQYFDSDSSGTHPTCVSAAIGVQTLAPVTAWLKQTGQHGFLGEFGATTDPTCMSALQNTLGHLSQNGAQWRGWTYWGASVWFGNYMFNVYPPDPAQHPQAGVLKRFLP